MSVNDLTDNSRAVLLGEPVEAYGEWTRIGEQDSDAGVTRFTAMAQDHYRVLSDAHGIQRLKLSPAPRYLAAQQVRCGRTPQGQDICRGARPRARGATTMKQLPLGGGRARGAIAAVGLTTLLWALPASAFCRSTTCDGDCEWDAQGCDTAGVPLAWRNGCVSYSVQADASARRNIGYDTIHEIAQRAFERWTRADCRGDRPSIATADLSPATCRELVYNSSAPNANVIFFRDDDWPYENDNGTTLAQTLVTFNTETGEIYDADIEVNSFGTRLTTSDSNVEYDLESIILHETGHFLGLGHSHITEATMFPRSAPGELFRTVTADDEAGICAIYPPNRPTPNDDCRPRHGFSPYCAPPPDDGGCAVRPLPAGSGRTRPLALALVLGAIGVGRLGRRRAHRAT